MRKEQQREPPDDYTIPQLQSLFVLWPTADRPTRPTTTTTHYARLRRLTRTISHKNSLRSVVRRHFFGIKRRINICHHQRDYNAPSTAVVADGGNHLHMPRVKTPIYS
uniref:Uncharacterized protein n=1 Tax=Plectus sambesii TaxID=2011161 RepID=A0A914XQZ5_9BILA